MTLYQRLNEYSESDYYGFHMPGHKRNRNLMGNELPYSIDITEIEGFDDLHHAANVLKEAQERAARVYGAQESHFLINGSTAGILSAVLGNTQRGDAVLVARNCHKSVYHGIYLNDLKPYYLYPEFRQDIELNTGISVSAVKTALKEHSEIRAVIIVSPTYDGVLSDVRGIAQAVHEKGIPLIVDEAHGAHFGFHPYFPENALAKGADVVIHSVHKTLPALTQSALLHMQGSYANRRKVRKYLDMLQSSSPSYILMAGIDACMDMLENRREEVFDPYVDRLKALRESLRELKALRLIETEGETYDPSKLLISAGDTGLSGRQLYRKLLEEYHLQMEMAAGSYVLAMTAVGDTKEGFDRLRDALFAIDAQVLEGRWKDMPIRERVCGRLPAAEIVYTSYELEALLEIAKAHGVQFVPWQKAAGYISTEYAYLYPPGIPLIVPGERITEEIADMCAAYHTLGFTIEGLKGEEGYIEVLENG